MFRRKAGISMKQVLLTGILSIIFMAPYSLPAEADNAQSSSPPPTTTQTTSDADAAKKKEDKDRKEKVLLEVKAKREAERRQREEEYHNHGNSPGGVVIVTTPGGGGGGGSTSGTVSSYSTSYVERPRMTAGVLYAPAQKGKSAAFGVQWIGARRFGVTAWLSGNLDYGEDVIDAAIPHDDFWTDNNKGSYALEGVYGMGSDSAMLVLGAGLAVTTTRHTAISNVTGWRWKAGSDSTVTPAGHASLRFRLADRVNMQFGYDTAQYAFFGLSGSF